MLKKINANGVESDCGFSIQITGPETLRYKCKNFSIQIDLEYDAVLRKIYIYASKLTEQNFPIGYKKIEHEKIQIIKNIMEAVKLLKGDFIVI